MQMPPAAMELKQPKKEKEQMISLINVEERDEVPTAVTKVAK